MKVIKTDIDDVFIIEPKVFEDERGFFFESFNHREFELAIGKKVNFVQDNHSKSIQGTLRGLHYQIQHAQGKLVRCVEGEVYDVAVDIRRESPTFGKWVGVFLSAENKRQLWIPEGFAHGFYVISKTAEFLYKTTDYRYAEYERGLNWQDSTLNIDWPINHEVLLSEKDRNAANLLQIETY
ncbi:TPA: dTDP-4-dehydrorhamnose 3,5-epimerase [Aeromonas veronii]